MNNTGNFMWYVKGAQVKPMNKGYLQNEIQYNGIMNTLYTG